MKKALLFWVLPVGVAALLIVGASRYVVAHTVDPAKLARVSEGMDWATASRLIGTSQKPVLQPDGSYFVALRKHDRWCMVDIGLDSSLQVTYVFHDH